MIERAVKYKCKKIQLFKPHFDQKMVDDAHAAGLICNVFYADTVEEAKKYLDMGIDTVLTNNYAALDAEIRKK